MINSPRVRPEPPVESLAFAAPARETAAPPPYTLGEAGPSGAGLAEILGTLADGKWIIAVAVIACLAAGCVYLFLAAPVYQSEVVLQFEEKGQGPVAGAEQVSNPDARPATDDQIEILRSRGVLGKVVDDLHLDLSVRPRYLPLIGAPLARRWPGAAVAGAWGTRFARGDERIRVDRFDLPPALQGETFRLVALDAGRYELRGKDGTLVLGGVVGRDARPTEGAGGSAPGIALLVGELSARPGTEFTVQRMGRVAAIERLRDALFVKDRSKKTDVVAVALQGPDPKLLAATLDGVARTYEQQSLAQRNAEAVKTMEFINAQLPRLRTQVEGAEGALNRYLEKNRSLDVGVEVRSELERLQAVQQEISAIELQTTEARQRYTAQHPIMEAAREKLARLTQEREAIQARLRKLPKAEIESARVSRDLKGPSDLYNVLTNKLMELQLLVNNSTVGNVRVVDEAFVPLIPMSPSLSRALGVALTLGLGLGVAGAFARRALSARGAEDPEEIEREVGIPVYGSIPHTAAQAGVPAPGRGRDKRLPLLAQVEPAGTAVEAVRSLRTSVMFALTGAANNVVVITGPSPATGKSFVSANLAQVLADGGSRVLLVDADMRRGPLHQSFGFERSPGLSDLIRGTATYAEAVRPVAGNLAFIPTGSIPPNPSELLGSSRFAALMGELSSKFDVVLVDTAPVLAVTDAVLAGRMAGTTLLVLRAGQHHLREIIAAARRLWQNGVPPHAIIMNDVMPGRRGDLSSRYGYFYHYEYR